MAGLQGQKGPRQAVCRSEGDGTLGVPGGTQMRVNGLWGWKRVPKAHALSERWLFHILICDSLGFWAPLGQPVEHSARETA